MEAKVLGVDEDSGVYPAKVRPDVQQRIAHMAGLGKGLALDAKPFFKLNTSLTTSPQLMAFATKPKWTKEEAAAIARAKYGV